MNIFLGLLLLLTAPVLVSARPLPEKAADPVPAALQRDARLEAVVSVDARDRPLGELLPELGKQVDVELTATRETADDRVSLLIRERPAREVLSLIAAHFDFQWRRERNGYRLGQDLAARNREAALRAAQRAADVEGIRRQLENLASLVELPPSAIQARLDEVSLGGLGLSREQQETLRAEGAVLNLARDRWSRPRVALIQSLTPAQRERLWRGEEIRLSTRNGTLSSRVVGLAAAARADHPSEEPRPAAGVPVNAVIRLTGQSAGPGSDSPPRTRRPWRLEIGLAQAGSWGIGGGFLPPPSQRTPTRTETTDPTLLQPVSLVLPPLPPRPHVDEMRAVLGAAWPPRHRLSGVLAALHEATDLPVIADSFIRAQVPPPPATARPVVQILDELSHDLDYAWEMRSGIIRLRSGHYAHDRPAEVPERILNRFREQAGREAGPTLDDYAALAAAVTDAQAFGLADYWGWYFEDNAALLVGHESFGYLAPHLRLWAALLPAQRQAAAAGSPIRWSGLTAIQRRAFAAALLSRSAMPSTDALRAHLSPEDLSHVVFRMQSTVHRERIYGEPAEGGSERPRFSTRGGLDLEAVRAALPDELQSLTLEPWGAPFEVRRYTFEYVHPGEGSPLRNLIINVSSRLDAR
jgi:hypothetical protein